MSSHTNGSIVAERFDFVINPDVAVWEEIVRLTTEHESWAMSLHDYPVWLDVFGLENFSLLVALEKDTRKVVGSVSSSTYPSVNGSKRLTTIGMFFVLPEYRGLGVGMALFNRLLSDPKVAENNKALTSASNMAQKYADVFGFDKFTDWNLLTMTAKIEDMELGRLTFPDGIDLVDHESVEWSKTFEYNSKFAGGINRDAYIKAWMTSPAAHSRVAVNQAGEIVGLGVVREAYNKRLSVGPLYADDDAIAEAIMRAMLASIANLTDFSVLKMEIPSITKGGVAMLNALTNGKANNTAHTFVQFTKERLETSVDNLYCIMEGSQSVF